MSKWFKWSYTVVACSLVLLTGASSVHAVEKCKVKVDKRNGNILFDAKEVDAATLKWGGDTQEIDQDFHDAAGCVDKGQAKHCTPAPCSCARAATPRSRSGLTASCTSTSAERSPAHLEAAAIGRRRRCRVSGRSACSRTRRSDCPRSGGARRPSMNEVAYPHGVADKTVAKALRRRRHR